MFSFNNLFFVFTSSVGEWSPNGSVMVSALDSGFSGTGLSPDQEQCVVIFVL